MDIDKLYLSAITFQVKREKGEDGKYHQTVTDQFDEKEDEYHQNKLLRNYLAILMDRDQNGVPRSTNILHRPIDNDTELLKGVLKKIEAKVGVSAEKPYGFYSLTTQTRAKNDYITGKIGIGPFALNNNNHILTMLYGVKFESGDNIMSKLGLLDLSNDEDKDGNQILSWISGLINAHVDIAKDPYISRLNVNPFTYNLVNLLVRTGFGENTFFFINQPIIKQIARAYNNASSMYMQDPYSSKYYTLRNAVLSVVKERFKNVTLPGINLPLDQLISPKVNKAIKILIQNMFKSLVDSGNLETMATQQAPKNTNLSFEQAQLVCYLAYVQFEPYAQAISNLVKYTKIDTKKHGKSLIEQDMYLQGFNKLFSDDNSLFEKDGLRRLRDESYVGHKTELAIRATKSVFAGHTLESTPQFLDAIHKTLALIGRKDSLDPNLAKKVARILGASIKSTFFNDYAGRISTNPHYMHDLVSNSRDDVQFTTKQVGNEIVLGKTNHPLSSYIGKPIYIWYNSVNGPVSYGFTIIGANESTNSVYIDQNLPAGLNGTASLMDGENTIFDRWNRLAVKIKTDPKYADLLDGNGEFVNRLLRELVPGNTYQYRNDIKNDELPDTYETLKFVKLFNASDDQNSSHTYLSQAWDELLNDNAHPDVQEFARDLVVYAFITSGDQQGFTKIFKYVPASWREESGYAEYIQNKINEMLPDVPGDDITDLYDAILNNWYDNDIVRTYRLEDRETKASNFVIYRRQVRDSKGVMQRQTSYPLLLAAIHTNPQTGAKEAFIDPENAPLFIKIPRRTDFAGRYESQRRFNIYQLIDIAKNADGVEYPVYGKVNPKGNQINLKFTITEYGRSDSYTSPQEYIANTDNMKKVYDTIDQMTLEKYNEYKYWYGLDYADIVFDLNREVVDTVSGAPVPEQLRAQVQVETEFDDSDFSDEAMKNCKS